MPSSTIGKRRLRTQLIIMSVSLAAAVGLLVSAHLTINHTKQLEQAVQSKGRLMRNALEKRGLALVHNFAVTSEFAIRRQELQVINEMISKAVLADEEILYGVIVDPSGIARVHSDPSHAGKPFDAATGPAANTLEPTTQELLLDGRPILEALSPITVGDDRWGILRFGLSLAHINNEIARDQSRLRTQRTANIATFVIAVLVLALISAGFAIIAAKKITRPLELLTNAVESVRNGRLDLELNTAGSVELAGLGEAINSMTDALRARDDTTRNHVASLKTALDNAERKDRLKSDLLANISHELRTPLNTILNVPASLLKEYGAFRVWHCTQCGANYQASDNANPNQGAAESCLDCGYTPLSLDDQVFCVGQPREHRHFLRRLNQSGQHLLSVVTELLDFTKLEAGRMSLQHKKLYAAALLRDAHDTMVGLAAAKEIRIDHRVLDGPLCLQADPVKVSQILINIVGNAIKFTPKKGSIDIRAKKTRRDGREYVQFTVTDTGIGVPADQHDEIFEGYKQGDNNGHHHGTGLGLSITRKLVELHGGQIWVESKPGAGSTFSFLLPTRTNDEPQSGDEITAATPKYEIPADNGRPRVMVIDDNPVHLELTRMVLEREGFVAELVVRSTEAIGRITERRPEFIILDVMMPELSGITLLKQLKARQDTNAIPVLVATAYHSNRELVIQLGGIWLPKPWNGNDLADCLREHGTA